MRHSIALLLLVAGCSDSGTGPDVNGNAAEPGTIITVAGTGMAGFSGDGDEAVTAQLNMPLDVLVRPSGEVVIVDFGNHRIRTIDASTKSIATLAGNGQPTGEDALNHPTSIALNEADFFRHELGGSPGFQLLPRHERPRGRQGGTRLWRRRFAGCEPRCYQLAPQCRDSRGRLTPVRGAGLPAHSRRVRRRVR